MRGTGPVSQTPGDLARGVVLHEAPARGFELAAQPGGRVVLLAGGAHPRREDSLPDVGAGERRGVALRQRTAQRHEPARVVGVAVAQDHVPHAREVDAKLARVLEDRLGARSRVEEQAFSVHFDEGGEAPLADAGIREHRREHDDSRRPGTRL